MTIKQTELIATLFAHKDGFTHEYDDVISKSYVPETDLIDHRIFKITEHFDLKMVKAEAGIGGPCHERLVVKVFYQVVPTELAIKKLEKILSE
ncbi:hypothetical protein [Serratia ureilytica]|uniref:hypothetical protein n=1 Tax=Serratia ureilytica TaxID=300181 RepID=UPI0019D13720|nr:hypothetical protein [Serratia ureilytica]MBN5214267.1 hypothetical protein [Serratia ureilytica]